MTNPVASVGQSLKNFVTGKSAPHPPVGGPLDQLQNGGGEKLGLLPRAVLAAGKGMAKLGGWGGAGVGLAFGLAVNAASGGGGILLPILGAFLYGSDASNAKRAMTRLEGGVSENITKDARMVSSAGASALLYPSIFGEMGLAFSLAGGAVLPALLVGVPLMLGTAFVLGKAAHKAAAHLAAQYNNGQQG